MSEITQEFVLTLIWGYIIGCALCIAFLVIKDRIEDWLWNRKWKKEQEERKWTTN